MKWIFSLLFLVGCQRFDLWQCHRIHEKTAESTRVLYKTRDHMGGVDVEFIRSGSGLSTYLQVHGQAITPSNGSNQAEVKITSVNRELVFLADFHKGKQRIRLSKVLQDELISVLTEGNPVIIELSGYRETIHPKHFQKIFQKLDSSSSGFLSKFKVSMMAAWRYYE